MLLNVSLLFRQTYAVPTTKGKSPTTPAQRSVMLLFRVLRFVFSVNSIQFGMIKHATIMVGKIAHASSTPGIAICVSSQQSVTNTLTPRRSFLKTRRTQMELEPPSLLRLFGDSLPCVPPPAHSPIRRPWSPWGGMITLRLLLRNDAAGEAASGRGGRLWWGAFNHRGECNL